MEKKFKRSRTDRKLAGVCGGLAECFDIDPLLIRIGWIALTFCIGGGLILYILLWILAPEAEHQSKLGGDNYLK